MQQKLQTKNPDPFRWHDRLVWLTIGSILTFVALVLVGMFTSN